MAAVIRYEAVQLADLRLNLEAAMIGLSVNTARAYRRWLKQYLADLKLPCADLEAVDLASVIPTLRAGYFRAWIGTLKMTGIKAAGLGQARAAVIFLAQTAAEHSMIPFEALAALRVAKMPKAERGQRGGRWLPIEDVRRILAAIDSQTGIKGIRDRALIGLLALCGLRRAEAAAVKWGDLVNLGGHAVIMVHGKGAKLREVKLPAQVLAAIEAWRSVLPQPPAAAAPMFCQVNKHGTLNKKGITDRAIYDVLTAAAERTGITVSPHDLRRSFARGAFEAGASYEVIRQSLGHASVATTERYVNATLILENAATDIWAGVIGEGQK